MGINLIINFDRPFFARTIRELWNRWHISLTSWFRDYLYIPLGGNKKGFTRQIINILIIFILSGLWHGANYTFILFGLSNGILVCGYLLFCRVTGNRKMLIGLPGIFASILTFFLFSLTCIFFRAENLDKASAVFSGIFRLQEPASYTPNVKLIYWNTTIIWGTTIQILATIFIMMLFFVEGKTRPDLQEFQQRKTKDIIFLSLLITIILFFGIFQKKTFIYFQFRCSQTGLYIS